MQATLPSPAIPAVDPNHIIMLLLTGNDFISFVTVINTAKNETYAL